MNRFRLLFRLLLAALLLPLFLINAHAEKESMRDKIVVIPVGEDSLSNSQSFGFITRILRKAQEEKAKAIIFDLNTPGGLAWETSELMMKELEPINIPTYAFVNPKAMSAGALISAACDTIYMTPVSSIGAAGIIDGSGEKMDPVLRKKIESAFSAFTRSVVEEKGHDAELIRAMMIPSDKERQFGQITLPKDELLTLTGKEAASPGKDGKPLLAKGLVPDIPGLLAAEKITAPIITATPTGFERIALWIAWASPALILIGMAAFYFEMKTPGFGIGGIIAIAAFALFFFGNNIAGNLAGYEMVAVFFVGVVLVIVEIFVVPGIMIPGIIGAILILVALFGGMVSVSDLERIVSTGDWSAANLAEISVIPLSKLALGLAGGSIAIMLLMRYLPDMPLFRKISNATISGGAAGEAVGTPGTLVKGSIGTTVTELKPNGKALFDGILYEVSSAEGILDKGTRVIVHEKRAFDILVNKLDSSGDTPGNADAE